MCVVRTTAPAYMTSHPCCGPNAHDNVFTRPRDDAVTRWNVVQNHSCRDLDVLWKFQSLTTEEALRDQQATSQLELHVAVQKYVGDDNTAPAVDLVLDMR